MPICQAQTPIKRKKEYGFTLTEAMIAIIIASLMAAMAMLNLSGLFVKNSFKGQVNDLVSTIQTAARSASQSSKRYEIIIDLIEQKYTLREITSNNLIEVFEDEIISEKQLNENCQIVYVQFDDLVETDEQHQISKFRVGKNGWQNGGRIVLLDRNNNPYTIIIERMNRAAQLYSGEVKLLTPRAKDEVPF